MNLEECLEARFIRKDETAKKRVKFSLEIAERFLRSSLKNFEMEEYEMAEIAAYNSIFHSGRALIFAKGYTERSHLCLFVAIKTLYGDSKTIFDMVATIDKIRLSRHDIQYGGARVDREEVNFVIKMAEEFLGEVKKRLLLL